MMTKSMKIQDNQIYYDNHSIEKIVEHYQSPLMIYDLNETEEKLNHFRSALSCDEYKLNVCYATKAFLCKGLISFFKERNVFMDAVSLGDLILLKKCHFPMEKVVFHGNNKSKEEIEFAVKNHVIIVVDHLRELERINELHLSVKQKIFLRINTHIDVHTHAYIKTALGDSKFGTSLHATELLEKIFRIIKNNPMMELLGFHSHIGSQIFEIEPYQKLFNTLLSFTHLVNQKYDFKLQSINFGGGFGVKYLEGDQDFNFNALREVLKSEMNIYHKSSSVPLKEVFFEPGRSLICSAGTTFYRTGYVKKTYSEKEYIFIDGGMNDNIRPALYQAEYQVEVANHMLNKKEFYYDIVGKCCETGDIIKKAAFLPKVAENDIIAVFCTGAYCYSMSSNYNHNLKPLILSYYKGKFRKMIKRQKYRDFLR